MYKYLQWHRFNLPSCSLHLESPRQKQNISERQPLRITLKCFNRCIGSSLVRGPELQSVTDPYTSCVWLAGAHDGTSHRRPVHADAVHAGVVGVSPVGRHLQLHDLEGPLGRLLCATTTRTAVGPPFSRATSARRRRLAHYSPWPRTSAEPLRPPRR